MRPKRNPQHRGKWDEKPKPLKVIYYMFCPICGNVLWSDAPDAHPERWWMSCPRGCGWGRPPRLPGPPLEFYSEEAKTHEEEEAV